GRRLAERTGPEGGDPARRARQRVGDRLATWCSPDVLGAKRIRRDALHPSSGPGDVSRNSSPRWGASGTDNASKFAGMQFPCSLLLSPMWGVPAGKDLAKLVRQHA